MIEAGITCTEITVYAKVGHNFTEEVPAQVFPLGSPFWQVELVRQVAFRKLRQSVIDLDQVTAHGDAIVVPTGETLDVIVFLVGTHVKQRLEAVTGHILFNGFFLAKQNECSILQLQFSGFPFFLGQTGMKQYIFICQLQPGMVRLDDCQDITAILESITVQIFQCQFFYNPFFKKMRILSFKERKQQFRLVGHINVCISIAVPVFPLVAVNVLSARNVQIQDHLPLNGQYLRCEVGTGQEQIRILDGGNDIPLQGGSLVWIYSGNLTIILDSHQNVATTMVQKGADGFIQ